MRPHLILVIFLLWQCEHPSNKLAKKLKSSSASIASVECYGSSQKAKIIFLHGIDEPVSNVGNRKAVKTMKQIADELKVRVAFPRSALNCQNSKNICWNVYGSKPKLAGLLEELNKETSPCFDSSKDMIFVGFSNGGYFVNKLAHLCLLTKGRRVIGIGAAGNLGAASADLSECADLALIVAKDEAVYKDTLNYYESFKKRKGRVSLTTFLGGHIVPYRELRDLLKGEEQ